MSETVYFEDRETEKAYRAEVRNVALLDILAMVEGEATQETTIFLADEFQKSITLKIKRMLKEA